MSSTAAPSDSEHSAPQYDYTNHYETEDNSHHSVSDYARLMHEHTKRQLSIAATSARRRSQDEEATSPSSSNGRSERSSSQS